MIIRRGYKFRLKPKGQQFSKLAQQAGSSRFVYNKLLSLNDDRYIGARFRLHTPRLSRYEGQALLKLWKKSDEYGWLNETDSQALQGAIQDLDRAYQNLFAGRADPPTKRKKFVNDSFRYPQRFKVEGCKVYLPKVGWVSFFKSQEIVGTMKNCTVSRKGDNWFVSIQVEVEVEDPIHPSSTTVGIDMGIAQFMTLSDGTVYPPLNAFRRTESKLAKAQQVMAEKVKFSKNWIKAKRKVNRLHTKIANSRQDYLHKATTEISKNHAVIAVEDLQVRNMSKSASRTVETHGKKVAQKSGLNKSILDQAWGRTRWMLTYKQLWRGGKLIAVPPHHTSQTCSECGVVDAKSRVSQSEFICVHCGFRCNADANAGRNIKTLAVGQTESLNACVA